MNIPTTNDDWQLYDFSEAGKEMGHAVSQGIEKVRRDVADGAGPAICYAELFRSLMRGVFAEYRVIGAHDTVVRDKLWDLLRADARNRFNIDLGNRLPDWS